MDQMDPMGSSSRFRGHTEPIADFRRKRPKGERQPGISALEVTDVVRYGIGQGSRIDLTIGCAGERVRLRLLARHVLGYGRIAKAAIEQGLVLPYERSANRAWRKVLARAMGQARVEPLLEGEEIAGAIAAEIQGLLGDSHRGDSASDLVEGKVVKQGDHLLVSPAALVRSVRRRLVDDVLPQATIAEAAAAHLGMRESRPRFADTRPRARAFPLPLALDRETPPAGEPPVDDSASSKSGQEEEELADGQSAERGAGEAQWQWNRSMDRNIGVPSPLAADGYEVDPLDRRKKRLHSGPAGGGWVVSARDDEMPSGTNGSRKNGRSHE